MNKCVDCEKEIVGKRTRCRSCTTKKTWEKRGVNPKSYCVDCSDEISFGCKRCAKCHYQSKKAKPSYCTDCKKEISHGAIRCKKCMGKNNRIYPENKYCIDCGKEICNVSVRCCSCATKACWRDSKYCENQANAWSDSEIRQKRIDSIKIGHNTPEYRQWMSNHSKQLWEDGICGSEEHIRKIAKSVIEAWERGCYDSKETRQKWSEISKRNWESPEYRCKKLESCAEVFAAEEFHAKKSASAKAAWARGAWDGVNFRPGAPYKTETNVAEVLDRLGIDYQDQYSIGRKRYDFYLPKYNLLIEYDGWYWHHSDWAVESGAVERDAEKDRLAKRSGFEIIRLTGLSERDLMQDEIMIQLIDQIGDWK